MKLPVSTIPAVEDKIVVFEEPYVMDSLMPQYALAGEVVVSELKTRQYRG